MDDLLADWLALREAADWAARSAALTDTLARRLPGDRPLRVLDLATGTGSNLRYLVERLPSPQRWLLVDRRADLLALVGARSAAWAATRGLALEPHAEGFTLRGPSLHVEVETRQVDLNLPLDAGLFAGSHLVTGSALLDLVSAAWLSALASQCRAAGAAALFALTYDGRSAFTPREPEDDVARDLLNTHQRRDKGLGGPAEGPEAHAAAVRAFRAEGFVVEEARTDWLIGPDQREFQRQLIEGLSGAGAEQRPDLAAALAAWLARRVAHLEGGRSHAVVGHHDLAAWPAGA